MSENHHENFFVSKTWGVLDFIPTKSQQYKETCRRCLLNGQEECKLAHCTPATRADKRQGYFSKHEMPKERETKSCQNN